MKTPMKRKEPVPKPTKPNVGVGFKKSKTPAKKGK